LYKYKYINIIINVVCEKQLSALAKAGPGPLGPHCPASGALKIYCLNQKLTHDAACVKFHSVTLVK